MTGPVDPAAPAPSPVVVAQFLDHQTGGHVAVVDDGSPYPFRAVCEACGPILDARSIRSYALDAAEKHAAKCLRLPARLWVPIPGAAATTGTDVAP